jgi:hypothetical protein
MRETKQQFDHVQRTRSQAGEFLNFYFLDPFLWRK